MKKQVIFSLFLTVLILSFSVSPAFAQFGWFKKKVDALKADSVNTLKQTSLSETEIGAGLKEALKIGINNAVRSTSKPGGYFNNEDIKIPLPERLLFLDKTLRKVGFGDKIDDFVLSMNKAAEQAAPAATDIFLDAVVGMSIEDAQKLLGGKDTAATDYFKEKTYTKLADAFRPTIDKALEKFDVTDKYNALISKYQSMPFVSKVKMLSPDDYVINKALDGLFFVLGQEETKIRKDPKARVTDILEKVFNASSGG